MNDATNAYIARNMTQHENSLWDESDRLQQFLEERGLEHLLSEGLDDILTDLAARAHNDGHNCTADDPELLEETFKLQVKDDDGKWWYYDDSEEWPTSEKARESAVTTCETRVVRVPREVIED